MVVDVFGLSLVDYMLVIGLIGAGAVFLLRQKKQDEEFDANSIKSFNMV
jgi:hypothetical protein